MLSAVSRMKARCARSAAELAALPFVHGRRHELGPIALFCSYHCSRYNTNTGVLTPEMFREVFATVRRYLDS